MKIIDKLNEDRIHISFEVFPPKTDAGFEKVKDATDKIAQLNPSYISVTYGAGGGTSKNTAKIASHIKHELGVESLAHLTCASSTKEEVRQVIENLKQLEIENILALRGDIVPGMTFTIEPMINMGTYEVFIDDADGWTVCTDDGLPSAQWENMILITETGNEILTY